MKPKRAMAARAVGTCALVMFLGARACGGGDSTPGNSGPEPNDGGVDRKLNAAKDSWSTQDVPQTEAALNDGKAEDGWSWPEAAPCSPPGPPSDLPAGWEPHTEWSCYCNFYVPGAKGELPPPIQWEPCPPPAPSNIACRRMKPFWTTLAGSAVGNDDRSFWVDPATGAAIVSFLRYNLNDNPERSEIVVAEADGAVRFGFLHAADPHFGSSGCYVGTTSMGEGKIGFNVVGMYSWKQLDFAQQGIIGGSIDDRHPPVVFRYDFGSSKPSFTMESVVSSDYVFRYSSPTMLLIDDWQFSATQVVYDPAKGA